MRQRLIETHAAVWTETDLRAGSPAEGDGHRYGLSESRLALGTPHDSLHGQDGAAEKQESCNRDSRPWDAVREVPRDRPTQSKQEPAANSGSGAPPYPALDVVTNCLLHRQRSKACTPADSCTSLWNALRRVPSTFPAGQYSFKPVGVHGPAAGSGTGAGVRQVECVVSLLRRGATVSSSATSSSGSGGTHPTM